MPLNIGQALAVFALALFLTWLWIRIAIAKKIHDSPERRRLHSNDIPRAGGIGIAIIMAGVSVYVLYSSDNPYSLIMVLGIFAYSGLGFLDDVTPLPTSLKLVLHLFIAGMVFLSTLLGVHTGVLVAAGVALAYLLLVNFSNFMDGSNGMLSLQSILIAFAILLLPGAVSSEIKLFACVLMSACLGFLPFNFPKARVFLGDVGSHVLGASLLGLAAWAWLENQWTLPELLCLFSALWVDAAMTLLRRGIRGSRLTQAHRSHLYQYAIRIGWKHASVALSYALWTLAMIGLVAFSRTLPLSSQQMLLIIVLLVACALHQWLRMGVLKYHSKNKLS